MSDYFAIGDWLGIWAVGFALGALCFASLPRSPRGPSLALILGMGCMAGTTFCVLVLIAALLVPPP